jgi:uncharacterized protein (TIGR02453 family)
MAGKSAASDRAKSTRKKSAKKKISATPASNARAKFFGLAPGALNFFKKLRSNNRREWFAKKKDYYESTLMAPMAALVLDLGELLAEDGLDLSANPKSPVMRIYRDVRFSANKTPYKTAISATLRRGGQKVHDGGLFIQFSDKERFIAMGYWRPERDVLHAWRSRMTTKPAEFLRIAAGLKKSGYPLYVEEAKRRMPRGFELHAGSHLEPYLKLTSFFAMKEIAPRDLHSPKLVHQFRAFARDTRPLVEYGWAIEASLPRRASTFEPFEME